MARIKNCNPDSLQLFYNLRLSPVVRMGLSCKDYFRLNCSACMPLLLIEHFCMLNTRIVVPWTELFRMLTTRIPKPMSFNEPAFARLNQALGTAPRSQKTSKVWKTILQ